MVVCRKDPLDLDTESGTTATQIGEVNPNEAEKTVGTSLPMVSRAILISRPNSHPFQERHLILDQPVKVGRSVARCRPAPNNAIFDCKVLSRNHALLWYENGKFFLQDTKSSNGTFVNNQRLSKGSEESPAREVSSGDIVQFGVDVVENTRKVTHGCIVATLKLFLPDGKEAKASPTTAVVSTSPGTTISTQDLYQLSQYLQEALHREQILETKLATLQRVVSNSQEASDSGWKVLIDEDRLLSRIETLESQLQDASKNTCEDKLREELTKLQEEKDKYQNTAKESLRKVLQEKLEAVRRAQDLESSLTAAEVECNHLHDVYENTQRELQLLASKNDEHLKEIKELTKKLKEAEDKEEEMSNKIKEEKQELENQLEEMKKQETVLAAQIESLQADNDFAKEQLMAMKARFEKLKTEQNEDGIFDIVETNGVVMQPQGIQVDIISEKFITTDASVNGSLSISEEVEKLKCQLENSEKDLVESRNRIQELTMKLDKVEHEKQKSQLTIEKLKGEIDVLKGKLEDLSDQETNDASLTIIYRNGDEEKESDTSSSWITSQEKCNKLRLEIEELQAQHLQNIVTQHQLTCTVTLLRELLKEAREEKTKAEGEATQLQELGYKSNSSDQTQPELSDLHKLMEKAQQEAKDRGNEVLHLQTELTKTGESLQDAKQQVTAIREKVSELEQVSRRKQEEVSSLKILLEEEKKVQQKLTAAIEQTKKQLQEVQQNAKQSQNEAEHLKKKVKSLSEELRNKANVEKSTVEDNKNTAEYSAVREECASLRARLQSLEAEIKKYRNDKVKLSSDYKKLQDSYDELETLKIALENKGNNYWKEELENMKSRFEGVQEKLIKAQEEIFLLNECYADCNKEKSHLQRELKAAKEDFQCMSSHSRTVALCSVLFAVLLAFLLTFCPTISHVTGTSEANNQT
ncbi:sarcolemmal membrane-associated protein-like isoform X2 [Limulus polyphemus]|uniref:Sarcolemmal membrane-associated protein-like isoform X2 n=1 Tax=Limulus polyphemus TaxID=6850 RepID=A0ABM1TA79_LIMPO|nr:sarcolemmal membrane-associated protein-like isoform X2 [Limulus polyphemus]